MRHILAFLKEAEKMRFSVAIFSMNIRRNKKQNTPRQRARRNEDNGSLHFLHRQPESGLIFHRSFVIYDDGGPPVSKVVDLGGPNRKLRHSAASHMT